MILEIVPRIKYGILLPLKKYVRTKLFVYERKVCTFKLHFYYDLCVEIVYQFFFKETVLTWIC